MHVHLLHGFLGLPTDWAPMVLNLKTMSPGIHAPQIHLHNLWKDLQNLPSPSLKNWALQFAQKLPPSGNILIGYSMGGRLAMHFPVWEQKKIAGIILLAAHPGILQDKEREARAEQDKIWADKFANQPWAEVVNEWNSQPVFQHDRIRPPRKESDFSRQLLQSALTHWSLASQENMIERLKEFQCPLFYIHGDKDQKFAEIGRYIKLQIPRLNQITVPGGHCPHFSNPSGVLAPLKNFLNGHAW